MTRPVLVGAVAALIMSAVPVAQAADVDGARLVREGNAQGATACLACHGVDGGGQPAAGFPRLAGLERAYLAKQLRDFQAGTRSNPIMAPVAKALSEDEIVAVAGYYSGLPVTAASEAVDPALAAQGEALARSGNWAAGVPACFQCHGPDGQGVGESFPSIRPQSAMYITAQIKAWKSGARRNDPVGLMKAVADRLSDDEIKAVSAYLASTAAPVAAAQ